MRRTKLTPREFCYWLQGFFEISGESSVLSVAQVEMIKNHLNLVFLHVIDPSYTEDLPEDLATLKQELLQAVHDGDKALMDKVEALTSKKPQYVEPPKFRC